MIQYAVTHWVAYEGMREVFRGTLDEVKEWFKTRDKRSYQLDDLDIYSCDAPDVYALAAEVEDED